MAGCGTFCGAFLILFLALLFLGHSMELVIIIGFSIVIALLAVMLIFQREERMDRKRAKIRNELNRK